MGVIMCDKMRICVVEDCDMHAMLLKEMITEQGHESVRVRTMAEFHAIDDGNYDFVLMDLSLPDSDTEETLNAVKKVTKPCAVTTGCDDEKVAWRLGYMGIGMFPKHPSLRLTAAHSLGYAERVRENEIELQRLANLTIFEKV